MTNIVPLVGITGDPYREHIPAPHRLPRRVLAGGLLAEFGEFGF